MTHSVDQLAQAAFEKKDAKAMPFQRQVYDALATNQNVILQAPTGSGKTFAALAPFILDAWGATGGPVAKKLIYSLPLRVLAGTLRNEYETIFRKTDHKLHFTNQYGGATEDPFLDGGDSFWKPTDDNDFKDASVKHLVFTTIDQTLSGFIGTPVGVSKRQANMVYGSILSGALVFDEFHLLKTYNSESGGSTRGWSFGTALHLLKKTPWPFMIMTATMSTKLRGLIAEHFNATSICIDESDLPYIRSQHETTKHIEIAQYSISGASVVEKLGKRTLVICNTVQRAQEVYSDICRLLKNSSTKHLLLHSRFLPHHRAEKERRVSEWFREGSQEEAIVVATQVVEAGLNISCDVMHTEISPIDSFLQRVGRAARFGSERTAHVVIYPLPDPTKTQPYKAKVINDTLDALTAYSTLEYQQLQGLIDPILEESQQQDFEYYWRNRSGFDERIHEVRWAVESKANREFVRDINNVEVVVANHQDVHVSPWSYPAISIPQGTLWKFRKDGGTVYGFKEVEDTAELGQGRTKDYTIILLDSEEKLPSSRVIIAPSQAAYTEPVGLQLGVVGSEVFVPEELDDVAYRNEYQREHYPLHLKRIYQQEALRTAAMDALDRLIWSNGKQINDKTRVVDLMIWSHDIAKLAKEWQRAHGDCKIPLAHGNRRRNPPPHAMESVVITEPLIEKLLLPTEEGDTVDAVVMAICTHHTPQYNAAKRTPKSFVVERSRQEYLRDYMKETGSKFTETIEKNWELLNWSFADEGYPSPQTTSSEADTVYALLVYILRRCDGLATSLASKLVENTEKKTGKTISNFI